MTIPTDDLMLDGFDSLDVARMQIYLPGTGKHLGWIDFCGPGHPKAVQLSDEQQRKALFEAAQKAVNNRWKPPQKTPQQIREETAKWLADRILGWSINGKGKNEAGEEVFVEVPFAERTAMALFTDPKKLWLLNAAADFLTTIENFMPAS